MPGLMFLAVCCLIQVLLLRSYIIENSGDSDVFKPGSPLYYLQKIGHTFCQTLDQCACGRIVDDMWVRKRTHFRSDKHAPELECRCPGGHGKHLPPRGTLTNGMTATRAVAQFPDEECNRILMAATRIAKEHPEGGRRVALEFKKDGGINFYAALQTLYELAVNMDCIEAWEDIMTPWFKEMQF